jgi:hypothetical protein
VTRKQGWALAATTRTSVCDIVAAMQPRDRQAAFRKAVLELNDEPTLENVWRYLAASRLMETAREAIGRQPKEKDR